MDNQKNILTMDFANNPDLKALVSSWSVGEEYNISLKVQLNEMTGDGAKFTVQEVTSQEPEPDGEEPEPIAPEAAHPVMMVMSGGSGGAAKPEPYVAP